MITVISPNPHRLLINVGMIVDHLRPCGTYTGRAGMWEPRSLVCIKYWEYFTAQHDNQAVLKISLKAKSSLRYLDLLICDLDPLMEEFLWCGGWAYSALGAFALSCPLCLHSILCWSSAPWSCSSVSACICFWWLGCECGICFTVVHTTWKQTLKFWVWLVMWSVCAYFIFYFFGLTNLHASRWFLS